MPLAEPNTGGDLARAAAAKGDDDEANAAKPLRFTPDRAESSDEEAPGDDGILLVLAKGDAALKTDGPFADANGEDEEAYDKNPL